MAETPITRPAHPLISSSSLHSEDGPLKVYTLPLEHKPMTPDNARECVLKAGNQVDAPHIKEKTILLVGESGSGKSTLVDAMLNYIVGVRREDPFRFKLIDMTEEETQNSNNKGVTCYTVPRMHSMAIPFTVKLVDTPGTLSTQDTTTVRQRRDNIRQFLSENDILFIDAVCFIVKVSDTKLTAAHKAIFDDKQIFGKDVHNNILVFVTFSDSEKPAAALKTMKAAGVRWKHHYPVNNEALYNPLSCGDDPDTLCKLLWDMTESSMDKFFQCDLQGMSSCSISQPTDCGRKRKLEDRLDKMQQQLNDAMMSNEDTIDLKENPATGALEVADRGFFDVTCYDWCLVFLELLTRCKTCNQQVPVQDTSMLIGQILSIIEELNKIESKSFQSNELNYIRSAIKSEDEEQTEGWEVRVRGLKRLEERYRRSSTTQGDKKAPLQTWAEI